jgi:EAL domain-containing protein (putative c-di-GMP-specific phosphodiesterase class I)
VSIEALVRWQHPRHGLMTPDRFLALAEEQALMHPLTLAGARPRAAPAARVAAGGHRPRGGRERLRRRPAGLGVPRRGAECLAAHGTPEGALRLELTESTVMREEGRALDTLARSARSACRCPSTTSARATPRSRTSSGLPVHELKIDRSFVLDMLSDRDDAIIVRSTVELGRSLGLRVVAEGVETVEHLEQLRYFGCHVAQGYVFSRPLPPAQLVAWLREHRPVVPSSRPGARALDLLDGDGVTAAILELAGRVMDGASLPALVDEASIRLRELVPHDDLVLYGLDEDSSTLAALHASGRWIPETKRERFPSHEGITGAALHERRSRNVARTDLDPTASRRGHGRRARGAHVLPADRRRPAPRRAQRLPGRRLGAVLLRGGRGHRALRARRVARAARRRRATGQPAA